MTCPRCQHENRRGAKFYEECAAPLARACASCGAQLSPTAQFCSECAHPAGQAAPSTSPRFAAPDAYTPKHLAEKILTSKAALEGERKQVTVLFADLKGSMELLAERDPEEARKVLDPVLERMMEAVHRYEGTVNQVMGDGIMALFGAPLAHEDHAVRACYAALRMQESVAQFRAQDWLILEAGSVSYGKATSYLPVIDLLRAYFKVHDRETPRGIREKVTGKLLTRLTDRGSLASLPTGPGRRRGLPHQPRCA